jgi:GTP pyrophosphokinase
MTKMAKCCNPLPGDDICGYISRGNGITIHRRDCETLKTYEFERLIEVDWHHNNSNKKFIGTITIIANDITGLVAKVTKKLNDEKVSLVGIMAKRRDDGRAKIELQVNISNKEELDNLINKLNNLSFVIDVFRTA